MGFYKVECKKCQRIWETLCDFDALETMICGQKDYYGRPKQWDADTDEENTEGCGNLVERVWQPMSFHISGKNLDGADGVSGHYSQAFGRTFKNKYEKYEWAEANGYREVTEQQADDLLGQQYEDLKEKDKISDAWTENLKASNGDKVAAATKTFVSKDMQDIP